MTSKNSSRSTCRQSTTRQTVSGVDKTSPMGPHSAVQNVADATTATGDKPVLCPYTIGSITCPTTGSTTINSANVQSSMVQLGSTATESTSGNAAAMTAPM